VSRILSLAGGVYFMLGKAREDRAPPTMIKAPSVGDGFNKLFGPVDVSIPTDADITAAYCQPSAGTLMAADLTTPTGDLPEIMPLPKAWVPYFLGPRPLKKAFTGMKGQLDDEARDMVEPLQQ
jgi:hypothetical protein